MGQMLRCIVSGQPEVLPVVAVIREEYGLLRPEDGLDSMSFGVPAKIGSGGVEHIYELPVDDVREDMERSAAEIKQDLHIAAETLRKKYGIEV